MHFSIPDTSEIKDARGSTYTVYNLQINGVYHCSLRYSKFHEFNAKLRKEFDVDILPSFPPKKIFSLTSTQVETRRFELEKYIQLISQIPQIVSSDIFVNFFISAQKESLQEKDEEVTLEVFTPNDRKVVVGVKSLDKTEAVYQEVASKLNIPEKFLCYFGLFLVCRNQNNDFSIVRRLQGFESPYISLKYSLNSSEKHQLSVRKTFWDPAYDEDLIEDRVSMNLLYHQAVSDVENGWVDLTPAQLQRLQNLSKKGSKIEYLKSVCTLKFYNHIMMTPCVADFPEPHTPASIFIGSKELVLRLQINGELKEVEFKITRIRCWRIASLALENCHPKISGLGPKTLELSFEYLVAKNTLKWISVWSPQAILISMCLQSVVDELILKKGGGDFSKIHLKKNIRKTSEAKLFSDILLTQQSQHYFTGNNAFDEIQDDDL